MATQIFNKVSESLHPWENEALDWARQAIPKDEDCWAWSNFTFIACDGSINEVDLLILTRAGFFLVEIKSRPGILRGDAGRWEWEVDGRTLPPIDNPVKLTDLKAKRLGSLLKGQPTFRGKLVPYVEPLVFCSAPGIKCELQNEAASYVCFRDPLQPGIVDAVTTRNCFGLTPHAKGAGSPKMGRLVTQAMKEAGIRQSLGDLTYGSYVIKQLIDEGPGYQDWFAQHVGSSTVRRVRRYLVHTQASRGDRERIREAARREFELLEFVRHENILRADDYVTDHELGPALIFEHAPKSIRLDHYIAQMRTRLTQSSLVDILRQIANTVRFAHGRRTFHRALSPQSILIADPQAARPQVKLYNWQAGFRDAYSGTGTVYGQVPGTSHIDERINPASTAYLAPEALEPDANGQTLDMFSLGAIAYHLFTGEPPAANALQLRERVQASQGLQIPSETAEVSEGLRSLIQYSTEPIVSNRIASADEFLERLDDVQQEMEGVHHHALQNPLDAQPGDTLPGGLTVTKNLGSGACSVALLVERNQEEMVLKVAKAPEHDDQLRAEGAVLQRIRHDRIVEHVETLEMGGRVCVLMRRAGQQLLSERLKKSGSYGVEMLQRLGEDLLEVLCFLEEQKVPHRDLKPDNIGIGTVGQGETPHLVLFDFSLASLPAENVLMGTRGYCDPFSQRWGPHCDRYSAAVTLYELATAMRPVWGDGKTDPSVLDCEVSIEDGRLEAQVRSPLAAFFKRALRRNSKERFENAKEMLSEWRRAFEVAKEKAKPAEPADLFHVVLEDEGPGLRSMIAIGRGKPKTCGTAPIDMVSLREELRPAIFASKPSSAKHVERILTPDDEPSMLAVGHELWKRLKLDFSSNTCLHPSRLCESVLSRPHQLRSSTPPWYLIPLESHSQNDSLRSEQLDHGDWLPWELLAPSPRDWWPDPQPLCWYDQFVPYRSYPLMEGQYPLPMDDCLRMLIVVNRDEVSGNRRQERIGDEHVARLKKLQRENKHHVKVLELTCESDLEKKLRTGDWNVISYVGHIEQVNPDGALICGSDPIGPERFRELCLQFEDIKCVMVLGCCGSQLFARTLLEPRPRRPAVQAIFPNEKENVPCVIGMQFDILADVSVSFLESFVDALLQPLAYGRVDYAFLTARNSLDRCQRAAPVLHLAGGSTILLATDASQQRKLAYARHVRNRLRGAEPLLAQSLRDKNDENDEKKFVVPHSDAFQGVYVARQLKCCIEPSIGQDEEGQKREDNKTAPPPIPEPQELLMDEREFVHHFLSRNSGTSAEKGSATFGIEGVGGAGKSSQARQLAVRLARDYRMRSGILGPELQPRLPVFCNLKKELPGSGPFECVMHEANEQTLTADDLRADSAALVFDGLDEPGMTTESADEWEKCFNAGGLLNGYPSVVTTRPEFVRGKWLRLPHFNRQVGNRFVLLPWTLQDALQLVKAWPVANKTARKYLENMLRPEEPAEANNQHVKSLATQSPLTTALLCIVCGHHQGDAESLSAKLQEMGQATLLKMAVDLMLERRFENGLAPSSEKVNTEQLKEDISRVALACLYDENLEISVLCNKDHGLQLSEESYRLYQRHSGLLKRGSAGIRDHLFADYFAAKALADAINPPPEKAKKTEGEETTTRPAEGWNASVKTFENGRLRNVPVRNVVDELIWNASARPILAMLAELLDDPAALFDVLVPPKPLVFSRSHNLLYWKLPLAMDCAAHLPPAKRKPLQATIDRIGTWFVMVWWHSHPIRRLDDTLVSVVTSGARLHRPGRLKDKHFRVRPTWVDEGFGTVLGWLARIATPGEDDVTLEDWLYNQITRESNKPIKDPSSRFEKLKKVFVAIWLCGDAFQENRRFVDAITRWEGRRIEMRLIREEWDTHPKFPIPRALEAVSRNLEEETRPSRPGFRYGRIYDEDTWREDSYDPTQPRDRGFIRFKLRDPRIREARMAWKRRELTWDFPSLVPTLIPPERAFPHLAQFLSEYTSGARYFIVVFDLMSRFPSIAMQDRPLATALDDLARTIRTNMSQRDVARTRVPLEQHSGNGCFVLPSLVAMAMFSKSRIAVLLVKWWRIPEVYREIVRSENVTTHGWGLFPNAHDSLKEELACTDVMWWEDQVHERCLSFATKAGPVLPKNHSLVDLVRADLVSRYPALRNQAAEAASRIPSLLKDDTVVDALIQHVIVSGSWGHVRDRLSEQGIHVFLSWTGKVEWKRSKGNRIHAGTSSWHAVSRWKPVVYGFLKGSGLSLIVGLGLRHVPAGTTPSWTLVGSLVLAFGIVFAYYWFKKTAVLWR